MLLEHITVLEVILQRAMQYGMMLKREKCHFLNPSV